MFFFYIILKITKYFSFRGNTDVLFGYNCGFYTLFVGSGTNSLQDIEKWRHSTDQELHKQVPDFYLPKLGDLMKILKD